MPDPKIRPFPSGKTAEPFAWFTRLQKNRDGAFLATVANAMTILANDPVLAGMLSYNAFTSAHLLMTPPPSAVDDGNTMPGPYPRPWDIADIALLQGYMQRVWCPKFARGTVEDAMLAEAARRQFHPVLVWLDGLRWDGKPRLDLWLVNAFDAENTPYHQAVAAKFMLAAVRRLRHPGCKFDYMMVLEGEQGIGKSTVLRDLFSEEWFSDAIPPDLAGRDAAMALLGVWCLEFSEIEHLLRAEIETIKAFLSRAVDRYRPPYGRAYVERPRQGILVGTTNSDDYLRDSTGNRRIWPVRCRAASCVWIAANRDQLWAEAAAREAQHESIWLDDAIVQSDAAGIQCDRLAEDAWTDPISTWLTGRYEVRISDVLTDGALVPRERQGKAQQMRAGAILRGLGWTRTTRRRERLTKLWFAPGHEP